MSSAELSEWMAFARLEPFGAQVEDLRFANLMALMANAMAPSKNKVWQALDFMPDYDGSVEALKKHQMADKILGFAESIAARRQMDQGVQMEKMESQP